jgi:hypothetical protein
MRRLGVLQGRLLSLGGPGITTYQAACEAVTLRTAARDLERRRGADATRPGDFYFPLVVDAVCLSPLAISMCFNPTSLTDPYGGTRDLFFLTAPEDHARPPTGCAMRSAPDGAGSGLQAFPGGRRVACDSVSVSERITVPSYCHLVEYFFYQGNSSTGYENAPGAYLKRISLIPDSIIPRTESNTTSAKEPAEPLKLLLPPPKNLSCSFLPRALEPDSPSY